MKFIIKYTDRKTGKVVVKKIEAVQDVIGIEIPAQPDNKLPALKVNINSDAILVDREPLGDLDETKGRVAMFEFTDLVFAADNDLGAIERMYQARQAEADKFFGESNINSDGDIEDADGWESTTVDAHELVRTVYITNPEEGKPTLKRILTVVFEPDSADIKTALWDGDELGWARNYTAECRKRGQRA